MSLKVSIRDINLLATVWLVAEVTSSKVGQFPKAQNVLRGDNVSMFCTFPVSRVTAEVYWWRWSEKAFIEPDSRKRFTGKKSSELFQLLNATVADSGTYFCKVKRQEKTVGVGSGSRLTVFVPPTPLKIVPVEGISPPSRKLVCKTVPFYPETTLEFSWLKNSATIPTAKGDVENSSVEGLFEASSCLNITPPFWGKDVYICLVSHVSLSGPASANYTVQQESDYALILGCAAGGMAFLILVTILALVRLKASRDVNRNLMEERENAELARHSATYAQLNWRAVKRFPKTRCKEENVVYAQTKGGDVDKVTYDSVQFPKSNETPAGKQRRVHRVADVNISKIARK